MFWKHFDKKKQIIDLCPSCQENLIYHCHLPNHVASISKHVEEIDIELDSPILHGWTDDMGMKWADECIPSPILHGWTDDMSMKWADECIPSPILHGWTDDMGMKWADECNTKPYIAWVD